MSIDERPASNDEADLSVDGHEHHHESPRARFWRRFVAQKPALIALGFIVLLLVLAAIGPYITPADPDANDLANSLADPFENGILGTDQLGRDTLSRLIVATRVAILAVAQALAIALAIGVPLGMIAGYFGGWIDSIIMRVNDSIMSFPALILAIALIGVFGPSLTNAMTAIGIIFAPTFLRLVRGQVLIVREETFVEASRSIGTPERRIIVRHILPNVAAPLLVQISLMSGFAILAEAGLSFLGLGVQPPQSSWGVMLSNGYRQLENQPWLVVFPGLAIGLTVLAFNVLGDAIRDSLGREVRTG